MSFDVAAIKADFPLLAKSMRGQPLVYLDTAASAQKPQAVIDASSAFYENDYANIHRGIYELSERATEQYEGARATVANFINAKHAKEIVFTRNATEAINLVAMSYAKSHLHSGDEMIITEMEHHANIVPWQLLCEETGIVLKHIPLSDDGTLDLEAYESLLSDKTRLVSFVHVSNVMGTVNPVEDITTKAHAHGAKVLLDASQSVVHQALDVQALDCDFLVFSGHKLYGPSGIGVLYGRRELLASMPPYQGGGDMIHTVRMEKSEFAEPPMRFEAGTPNIVGAIGLAAAIEYVQSLDREAAYQHERALVAYALEQMQSISSLRLLGSAKERSSVICFTMDHAHPHDISTILDHDGIAIRAGHHCAMPIMQRFKLAAAARISFGVYSDHSDIDRAIQALKKVEQLFK